MIFNYITLTILIIVKKIFSKCILHGGVSMIKLSAHYKLFLTRKVYSELIIYFIF